MRKKERSLTDEDESLYRKLKKKERAMAYEDESSKKSKKKKKREKRLDESSEEASRGRKRKPKPKIVVIDGQLYALDENGEPSKRLRKKEKGKDRKRALSEGPARRRRSQSRRDSRVRRRARSLSLGGELRRRSMRSRPKEWTDQKGRRHTIDDDGNEIVFDKNGRKMRKKKKVEPGAAAPHTSPVSGTEDLRVSIHESTNKNGSLFDSLWDDEPHSKNKRGQGGQAENDGKGKREVISLSAQISEVGKENRELQLKLMEAEEEIEKITEQNRKEKAKNVKVTADMMQLKADYTEASDEIENLMRKVKDLNKTIEGKDKEIDEITKNGHTAASPVRGWTARHSFDLEENNFSGEGVCPTCGKESNAEVDFVFAENQTLKRELEFAKTNSLAEMKKKDDKLVYLTNETKSPRDDLEMIIRGEKGNGKVNPILVRLLNEKKQIQTKYEQEMEVTAIRLKGMQEMVETLEKENDDLKKQQAGGSKGRRDDSYEDLDMGDGIRRRFGTGRVQRSTTRLEPDSNHSMDGVFSKYSKR